MSNRLRAQSIVGDWQRKTNSPTTLSHKRHSHQAPAQETSLFTPEQSTQQ